MAQHHSHGPTNYGRAFAIGVALNVTFVFIEAFYGYLAHSLALIADAGHNLSDVLGLLLAWGASILARRLPTQRRTYGLRRSSILAALINAIILLVAVGGIAWEAIRRFNDPSPVAGGTVIWVAVVGIVINTATALLFLPGRKGDLNIRGAFLHMAADAGVSLGVVFAGLAILATGRLWLDPVVSLLIVAVILVGSWGLLRDFRQSCARRGAGRYRRGAGTGVPCRPPGCERRPRSPYLGHEYDRDGAHRPPRHA